jgi:hypothetical protein
VIFNLDFIKIDKIKQGMKLWPGGNLLPSQILWMMKLHPPHQGWAW